MQYIEPEAERHRTLRHKDYHCSASVNETMVGIRISIFWQKMVQLGGYSSAERCRLAVGRSDVIDEKREDLVNEHVSAVM